MMKVAIVEWIDAHASNDFQGDIEVLDLHKPRRVTSVGFVYKNDAIGVTLVRDEDDLREFDGRIFIPAGMIKKVKVIRGATE